MDQNVLEYLKAVDILFNQYLLHLQLELKQVEVLVMVVVVKNLYYSYEEMPYLEHLLVQEQIDYQIHL